MHRLTLRARFERHHVMRLSRRLHGDVQIRVSLHRARVRRAHAQRLRVRIFRHRRGARARPERERDDARERARRDGAATSIVGAPAPFDVARTRADDAMRARDCG